MAVLELIEAAAQAAQTVSSLVSEGNVLTDGEKLIEAEDPSAAEEPAAAPEEADEEAPAPVEADEETLATEETAPAPAEADDEMPASEEAAEVAEETAPAVVEEAAEVPKKGTRNPFKKAKNAASMIGGIKGEISGGIQQFKEVRAAKKQLDEARTEVLKNATLSFSLLDYTAGTKREGRDNRLLDIFDVSQLDGKTGAFVIATYKRLDLDKDLADYNGVYVGMGENVREEMDFVMSREGDPDVYADVKYFQNVRFYLFECSQEEMTTYCDALLAAFADEKLYNA